MSTSATHPPSATDGVPVDRARQEAEDIALLSGPEAAGLLAAVLGAEGVELDSWRTHRVHHRPGVGVTVGWEVTWRAPERSGEDYLLGSTAPLPPDVVTRPGVTAVAAGDRTVHVWRYPVDPVLPGLAPACDATALAGALGVPAGELRLELVTYRPLRRAVLRARGPEATWYVKVVRPHTASDLLRRHAMLLEAGLPVAPAREIAAGVVVLDELRGRPLTDAFAVDGAASVDPLVVPALLDRLPVEALELPHRPSWTDRVLHHASAAAAAVPERADELLGLGHELADVVARTDPGPPTPTHGDLHEANLLVEDGAVVGMLDVDGVGPGHRVDDLACLLGHLSVLPALAPEVHRHVPAAVPRWLAVLERGVDPAGLRARSGAVALSLVAGADERRDADARIAAVHSWLDAARS